MQLVTSGIGPAADRSRLRGKIASLRPLVSLLGEHLFLEHFPDQPRNARFLFRGSDSGPPSDILIEGDRHVLHYTILVLHEPRVQWVRDQEVGGSNPLAT